MQSLYCNRDTRQNKVNICLAADQTNEARRPSQGATGRKQHDFPKVTFTSDLYFRWNFEGI
jgi:hypothetical protein